MKKLTSILLLLLLWSACHKPAEQDVRDYHYIQGKWRLLYSYDGTVIPVSPIYSSDNYELEFTSKYKFFERKNGKCEKKMHVRGIRVSYPFSTYTGTFFIDFDGAMSLYGEFNSVYPAFDTLHVSGFYPETGQTMHNVYVRE